MSPYPPFIPPFQAVPRIPEDQPLIIRQSLQKRLLLLGAVAIGPFALLGLLIAIPAYAGSGAGAAFGTFGCFLVLGLLVVGLQFAVQWRSGPLLAAGPAGLWIRTRPFRSAGIWLPWESVQQIYRRRWALEKYLCFKPYDPRVGQYVGGLGQLDVSMSTSVFGTGLLLSLVSADRSEAEILQAVAYYANGRVHLM